MKILAILISAMLVGACGSYRTIEELEAEATLTGDWSLVERREAQIARKKARKGPSCGSGEIAYCTVSFGDMRCSCGSATALRRTFDSGIR